MPEQLPEHIDQLEDFYKSAFSNDAESPSPELWGKLESRLVSPTNSVTGNFWKNGIIRLSIEFLVLSSILYYLSDVKKNTSIPIDQPIFVKEKPQPEPLAPAPDSFKLEEDIPVKKITTSPTKVQGKEGNNIPNEVKSEQKTEEINPEKEIIQSTLVPVTEKVNTQPEPLPIEEPQDLYSKLKKKHVRDSSRSLFIEKKK